MASLGIDMEKFFDMYPIIYVICFDNREDADEGIKKIRKRYSKREIKEFISTYDNIIFAKIEERLATYRKDIGGDLWRNAFAEFVLLHGQDIYNDMMKSDDALEKLIKKFYEPSYLLYDVLEVIS